MVVQHDLRLCLIFVPQYRCFLEPLARYMAPVIRLMLIFLPGLGSQVP